MELISLHLPKTGGTSFYDILKQVYGPAVSKSYRRRDYLQESAMGNWEQSLPDQLRVLHGHFYYKEVETLHRMTDAKLITWVRDPVQRVISNYHFFRAGLQNPEWNPRNYELNQHRKDETLLEYAARPENHNRMTAFLIGAELTDFFFIGILENFGQDVKLLGTKINWSNFDIPRKNVATQPPPAPAQETLALLRQWNGEDVELYEKVLEFRRGTPFSGSFLLKKE